MALFSLLQTFSIMRLTSPNDAMEIFKNSTSGRRRLKVQVSKLSESQSQALLQRSLELHQQYVRPSLASWQMSGVEIRKQPLK